MKRIYRPCLSDHAYQRFCERFGDTHRRAVRARIMGGGGKRWLACGAVRIWNHRGMNIIAFHGVVKTLWPAEWGKSKRE